MSLSFEFKRGTEREKRRASKQALQKYVSNVGVSSLFQGKCDDEDVIIILEILKKKL